MSTHASIHPLNDPALAEEYHTPRSGEEICREKNREHLAMVNQEGWRRDLFRRHEEQRARDMQQLEKDLEAFRKTGKMPAKPNRKGHRS